MPILNPKAFAFGSEHVAESHYEMTYLHPAAWLDCGSELLRASKAVARQSAIDAGAQRIWLASAFSGGEQQPPPRRASVISQAAFLGVLAVENGLKGIIAASRLAARTVTTATKLPKDFDKKGHDLEALAKRAGFTTSDAAENEVLRGGEWITVGTGRYPTMRTAKETPSQHSMNPQGTFDACERLFFACVDAAARTLYVAGTRHAGDGLETAGEFADVWRKKYVEACGGVSPAWIGEEQVAMSHGYAMALTKLT
jgi:hypothetical protein